MIHRLLARPKRLLWLALWASVLVGVSLGLIDVFPYPYGSISAIALTSLFIWVWPRLGRL